MAEAKLQARVEVVGEFAALYTVVRAFEFDAVVSGMGDVESEKPPIVTCDEHATVAHHLFA